MISVIRHREGDPLRGVAGEVGMRPQRGAALQLVRGARPPELDGSLAKPPFEARDARLHDQPGGAVFSNICINCHGPLADSKGLLSEAISEMTGGAARVANLRDGLLGPKGMPRRQHRARVQGDRAEPLAKNEQQLLADLGPGFAGNLSWMAMGGGGTHGCSLLAPQDRTLLQS
jgi:mono/diheme cytochrome c family protein